MEKLFFWVFDRVIGRSLTNLLAMDDDDDDFIFGTEVNAVHDT